jgi:hypothetical protein
MVLNILGFALLKLKSLIKDMAMDYIILMIVFTHSLKVVALIQYISIIEY